MKNQEIGMNELLKQLAGLSPEKRELFELMLKEKGIDLSPAGILPQSRRTNRFPLSFGQQRLWFLDQLEPGSPLYNNPASVLLTGPLNIVALERSLNAIITRHEVLRTVFKIQEGEPVQEIQAEMPIRLEIRDISQLSPDAQAIKAHKMIFEDAQKPFDLTQGPLWRTTLLILAPAQHRVVLTMHHAVSDAWSLGILVQEIAALYAEFSSGKSGSLKPLAIQYADYAVWQRQRLQGKFLEEQLEYWGKQLAGCPPALNLPTDFVRPAYQNYQGRTEFFTLPTEIADGLNALSKQADVTLFMIFLSALQTLLARYSRQDDICVGTPIAGRNRAETEPLLGFFINTLVLRADLADNPTFQELLRRVKDVALGAFAHQEVPFEMLVEKLQPERDMSRSPLFQVMFVHQNAPIQELKLPNVTFEFKPIDSGTAKFDLTLVIEEGKQLNGSVIYNTDLFRSGTIERFIQHFQLLLRAIIKNPAQRVFEIPLLGEPEEQRLREQWSHVRPFVPEFRDNLLTRQFEAQAARTPNAVAVVLNDDTLTYHELNCRANQIAHLLNSRNVGPEVLVGICLERSLEMVIAILGILKAGAAFLPLDPEYPKERLEFMLRDSGISLVLTQTNLIPVLPEQTLALLDLTSAQDLISRQSDLNPAHEAQAENLAYVIYTSGSTGTPKGVQISIGALSNHCANMQHFYRYTSEDRVLEFASINFDAALEQLLPPLLAGSRLVLRGPEVWSATEFQTQISRHQLTMINPPTAYWQQMTEEWAKVVDKKELASLRLVIAGGDLMRPATVAAWQQIFGEQVRLLNAYGPTETTITSTICDIFPHLSQNDGINSSIPIGFPLAHRKIYILDDTQKLVPTGVPGELCIGGICLARGYLNRPELTAGSFIPDPFSGCPGGRLYRTGDLVRFLSNGEIEFLGRVDDQVKIRGFRIELGEIEAILKKVSTIRDVIVTVREDKPGEKRLVAYWEPVSDTEVAPGSQDLRQLLREKLPEFMIPSAFIALEALPRTPIGKIDRRALPAPATDSLQPTETYVAPRNPVEELLANLWATTLSVQRVGIHDNFFNLGGHSLMATQIVSRVREQFQVELPLRRLFESPTVASLALAIAEKQAEQHDAADLDEMLSELEDLSEEEVRQLLNEEITL
jgi:amino acid adenylation domain-containing protein